MSPGDDRLAGLRADIQRVDREIIALVAERVRIAGEIGALKQEDARATLDPGREAAVIRAATELGRADGLDPEGVRELFWTLVGMCRRAQLEAR